LSECAVGLEDQALGFVEVGSGFVERRPSLGDRRVRTVALTESGRTAQEAIRRNR